MAVTSRSWPDEILHLSREREQEKRDGGASGGRKREMRGRERKGKVQKKKSTTKAEEAEGGRFECVDLRIRCASLRIPRWRVYATGHNGIRGLPRSSSSRSI